MSLTSSLSSSKGLLNLFFKEKFPSLDYFASKERSLIKSMQTKVPFTLPSKAATTIGTAFDYAIRLEHFNLDLSEPSLIHTGMHKMYILSGLGGAEECPANSVQKLLWYESTKALLEELPDKSKMKTKGTDTLYRISVILAWLDSGFRSGGFWSEEMKNLALSIDENLTGGSEPALTYDNYSAIIPDNYIEDLSNLMEEASPFFSKYDLTKLIVGPNFSGSIAVGGADADFIYDRCLYDIKTTKQPQQNLAKNLRQILAYALIDFSDEFELTEVGLYFSRQAHFISWPIDRLIPVCTGNISANIFSLREDLKNKLELNTA